MMTTPTPPADDRKLPDQPRRDPNFILAAAFEKPLEYPLAQLYGTDDDSDER